MKNMRRPEIGDGIGKEENGPITNFFVGAGVLLMLGIQLALVVRVVVLIIP
jgi:hypothetical protein